MPMTDLRGDNVETNDYNKKESLTTKQRLLQSNRTVIAASSAAVTSVLAGFPFDSVKTRMQTHYYPSMMSCVRTTFAEEGARGFFRGMIPPLITVSIIKSVSFSVYESTKQALLKSKQGFTKDTELSEITKISFLSGGVSGAFIALLSCPLELVKIQRQLEQILLKNSQQQMTNVQASSWYAVKQIVKKKGLFGLWSGLTCHSARDALGTSIYFAGYETMKRTLSTRVDGPLTHFMSGGFCGILSWLFVFPVDAIKTNLQKDIMMTKPRYHGFIDCAISLVKMNGLKGLYRGLNVTLIRAFPIHSLNFLVYEQVLKSIPPSQ
ncbi:mitochondrial carrier domain-containing protein [Cokeromyces recurvatus]|uniref:mitochondrial carrier domain-containing protein n=1 Tax=Cokeromyces recurvatus TaxID=90255 RepID=UPI00221F6345|nr:mitochondrial carrier domain-containing protein [Cokeromyces recurvatus]KAI7898769.1 mitochondrial carrier domain-containing protein [Cokeromyces recurvatus]